MVLSLLGFIGTANAALVGKLDLASSVQPFAARELHDGQWLAGVAHPNLFHADLNGIPIFHAGIFQCWNTENGNASFGPMAGIDLGGLSQLAGVGIPQLLDLVAQATNLQKTVSAVRFIPNLLSIDGFAGYRPIHTADVNGEFVYGYAFTLSIPFGLTELQQGMGDTPIK